MKRKLLVGISTVLLGAMVFTGCGNSTDGGSTISIIGSTTVAVPMEELAEKYKETNPDVVVEVQGVGSSAGIKAAEDGTADIGMASRELKEEEKAFGLEETVIAYDGIAIVVHPSNTVADLTTEQVKGIFDGTITNWSEVGGSDQDIIVVSRESGSGTRAAFEEMLDVTMVPSALIADGNGAIKANVASKENSIGFVSAGFIDETVGAVSIDGVAANVDTIKSGEYKVSRPLLIMNKPDAAEEVDVFIDFILSDEGQNIVGEKYISVN